MEGTNRPPDLLFWHLADPLCKHVLVGATIETKHVPALQRRSKSHKRVTFIQGQSFDAILEDIGFGSVALKPFISHAREINGDHESQTRADSGISSLRAPENVSLLLFNER
jgi:hypothetical protein